MPVRTHDGRHLADLRRDQRQPLFRQPKNVHLNVKCIVSAEFSDAAARQDIDVEALEDASEGAGIRVSSNGVKRP